MNTIEVKKLLRGRDRKTILEEARAAPLEVPEKILGDGKGEIERGMSLGWRLDECAVQVAAKAKVTCGNDPVHMLAAMDHCQELVNAVLADQVEEARDLLAAMRENDVKDSGG